MYYRCHGRGCRGTGVREEALELAVRKVYERIALKPTQLAALRALLRAFTQQSDTTSDDHQRLQLAALKQRQDRLVDALVDGSIDQATFGERRAGLLIERTELEERMATTASSLVTEQRAALAFELAASALLSHERATDAERRKLLQTLTSNRIVDGKQVVVEPCFPFEHLSRGGDITSGAPGRIRTSVGRSQQIYSLPSLTA